MIKEDTVDDIVNLTTAIINLLTAVILAVISIKNAGK